MPDPTGGSIASAAFQFFLAAVMTVHLLFLSRDLHPLMALSPLARLGRTLPAPPQAPLPSA
ncbi:hypothetical protein BIV25_36440 [Streptomyces sp. MUSC 14]|uniref:hypothetical protein n=1 Tax=Streptomyces sp. MUSC 14 TaxID=1354889 RepID=UPI0008F57164|nr:hypothetical protein [Streptomyces sp. MUSC 14]OIJ88656.1 hypothetical protein BIV25_36440 [Streptomyces sp. MUSC 14]